MQWCCKTTYLVFYKTNSQVLSLLKISKSAYFIIQDHFFLEIFAFLSWLFGYVEKRLDKIATSQTRQKIILIHILSDISKSKGNQEMKVAELIKDSTRNVFIQKMMTWGKETSSRPLFVFS